MFFETIKLALNAIRRNALRSFLTLLGVVIGVGAVIAMVTIGRGTTAKVTADLARLGSNLLVVGVGQSRRGRPGEDPRPGPPARQGPPDRRPRPPGGVVAPGPGPAL